MRPLTHVAIPAILVLFFATFTAAEESPLARYRAGGPDSLAASVPDSISARVFSDPERSLPSLVAFLSAGEDPLLTVRRIHDWIALNIAYDTTVPPGGHPPAQVWPAVLAERKGVCSGYANLFAEMARLAGVDCRTVAGYARGIDFDLFTEAEAMTDNHAWNIVTVAGRPLFVDCTWDAGRTTAEGYTPEYSTAFLFAPPEEMIYSHVPSDPALQLLTTPLDRAGVLRLPVLRSGFFAFGLSLASGHGVERMNTADNRASFTVRVPDGVLLTAALFEHGGIEMRNRASVRTENGVATVTVLFPRRGEFVLRLFARRADSGQKMYSLCAEFGFFAASAAAERFPILSNAFAEHGCILHSPLTSPLRTGDTVTVRISAPGAKNLGMNIRGKMVLFDREPGTDTFARTLTVPFGRDLLVGADFDGSGTFAGIVKFEMGR